MATTGGLGGGGHGASRASETTLVTRRGTQSEPAKPPLLPKGGDAALTGPPEM